MSDTDTTTTAELETAGGPAVEAVQVVGPSAGIDAIVDLARRGVESRVEVLPDINGDERILAVHTVDSEGESSVEFKHLDGFGERDLPRDRVKGRYELHTIAALIDYVAPFVTPHTTAWVDQDTASIEVVFDDHAPDADATSGPDHLPGYREHTATLKLKDSPEWEAWSALDGQYLPQEEFALFLEDQLRTVVKPPAAKLLEVVTAFESTVTGSFKSAVRLDNGERQLVYEETITDGGKSKGGQGIVKLPEALTLTLRRFVGEQHQEVQARFRRRQTGPKLFFGIVLDDVDEITEQAVEQVAAKLKAAVPRTFAGTGQ